MHPQWILLMVLGIQAATCSSERTSCSAKSVVVGQAGFVTCKFPVDVAKQKQYVNILRYDFDGQNFVPELVLKCFWSPARAMPRCSVAKGFDFDGQINSTVTVAIPQASRKRHQGVYSCDYGGAAPSDLSVCGLHVKRNHITCLAPPALLGEATAITCKFNSNLNDTKDNFYVSRICLEQRPEDVLTCNWVEDQQRYYCFTKEGYSFNTSAISDRITITIPALERHQVGTYYCNTVPAERGVKAEQCRLTDLVKEPKTEGATSATEKTTAVSGSANSPKPTDSSSFLVLSLPLLINFVTML